MNKTERLEKYIWDFISSRFHQIDTFYWATYHQREFGIYKLKQGSKLLDFFSSVHANIENKLNFENLIPQIFVSPDSLLTWLGWFKTYLNDNQIFLDMNILSENTSDIILDIQHFKNELIEAIDYIKITYDYEDTVIPYQELRYKLIISNIPDFIIILKSILASVSYAITKTNEGFYHSNVHLILKLLGFEIISEELTNNGRIDAAIRFSDKIYIIEFKFSDSKDLSTEAFQQILDKEYALKFILTSKEIYGIGISFGNETRNINGFKYDRLN